MAACSRSSSMPASRARTVTTTKDRQNMMCATRIVQKPSCPESPEATKRASSEEPSTISGAAIGRKISRLEVERPAKSWRTSANAASVPRIVAPARVLAGVQPVVQGERVELVDQTVRGRVEAHQDHDGDRDERVGQHQQA